MIEQVHKMKQEKHGESPIWGRVEAMVLDAQALEGIEDASISHLTGTMVYNLVANGRQALEAAHRVLQPGGVIGMTLGAGAEWMDLVLYLSFVFLTVLLRCIILIVYISLWPSCP